MLCVDGYVPLGKLYRLAWLTLTEGLIRWRRNIEAEGGEGLADIAFHPRAWFLENYHGIITTLTWRVLLEENTPLSVLTPTASIIRLNGLDEINLPFSPVFDWHEDGGMPWDWYLALKPEILHSDGWQEMFLSQKLFARRVDRTIFIDWEAGILRCDGLPTLSDGPCPRDRLKVFRETLVPYHGMPLIVPEKIMERFAISSKEDRFNAGIIPYRAILQYLDDCPEATKPLVQSALFPEMSNRQFETHWARAREERPEISKPGRRPG